METKEQGIVVLSAIRKEGVKVPRLKVDDCEKSKKAKVEKEKQQPEDCLLMP